jgi:hypothetical protein
MTRNLYFGPPRRSIHDSQYENMSILHCIEVSVHLTNMEPERTDDTSSEKEEECQFVTLNMKSQFLV